MPGRGTPWRGVGKGVPNRIGSPAIADGSITEVDLDSSVTAKLNSAGGHVIQDEGTPLTQQSKMNFTGAGVTATVGGEDTTIVTIPGGGGGGGAWEQIATVTVSSPAISIPIPFTPLNLDGTCSKIILCGSFALTASSDSIAYTINNRTDGGYTVQGATLGASVTGVSTNQTFGWTTGLVATSAGGLINFFWLELSGEVDVSASQGNPQIFLKERFPSTGIFYGGGLFSTLESAISSFEVKTQNATQTIATGSKFVVLKHLVT